MSLYSISKQSSLTRNELISFITNKSTNLFRENERQEHTPENEDDYGYKGMQSYCRPIYSDMNDMKTGVYDIEERSALSDAYFCCIICKDCFTFSKNVGNCLRDPVHFSHVRKYWIAYGM